jgi:hypothetical protein
MGHVDDEEDDEQLDVRQATLSGHALRPRSQATLSGGVALFAAAALILAMLAMIWLVSAVGVTQ